MKLEDLEPLPTNVQAMLRAEARRPEPGTEFHELVLAGVLNRVGAAPKDSGAAPIPTPARARLVGSHLAAVVAGAALGGVAAFASLPKAHTVYVERVVSVYLSASSPPPPSSPIASVSAAPPPSSAVSAVTKVRPDASTESTGWERDTDLAAERALLDAARTALGRGDGAAALDAIQRHRQKFPRSQLGEEREVIGIQALMRVGRASEARERAESLVRNHPSTPFRTALEQIVGGPL